MTGDDKELESRIQKLESRIATLEDKLRKPETKTSPRKKSLNEFKREHDWSSHTEKAVLISYYLEFFDSTDEWSLHDIKEGYKRCKWPLPSNLSDVLRRTEGKGHIMQIGTKERAKVWQLTETGIKFVEDKLKNTKGT